MSFDTISVIGLGYIGLPTAVMFASRKKFVIGLDINKNTVDTINRGDIHIVEPKLDILVHKAVTEGYLRATTLAEPAEAFLIAVPTPFKKDFNTIPQPDLSHIEAAATAIAPVLKKGDLVILESTSPIGATEKMAAWLSEVRTDLTFPQTHGDEADINVAHCPERVLPGNVVSELVENDRVIGGMSRTCSERAVELYKCFVKGNCVITNARTAEMVKLTENACRDVQIAFANELSIICDKLDIDVWELIALANHHPRINILQPGPGVGGHCIAVDPWFIVNRVPEQANLIRVAREINDGKPDWVIEKVKAEISHYLLTRASQPAKEIKIACLGLAFKPNIDDVRGSPALEITLKLSELGLGEVVAVEPHNAMLPDRLQKKITPVKLDEALSDAQILILLVAHTEFRGITRSLQKNQVALNFCFADLEFRTVGCKDAV